MTRTSAERHAAAQYTTTDRLAARIAVHRFGTQRQPWPEWVADRLPLTGGEAVFEAGSGTGALWSAVDRDRLAPRLTLTDASEAMCDALRRSVAAPVTVLRCPADAVPLPDGGFDGVVANHMLYHLDQPLAGLREFHRLLRPGGWLVVTTLGSHSMVDLGALVVAAGVGRVAPGRYPHFNEVSGLELVSGLFEQVRLHAYDNVLVVPTVDPVVEYLSTFADTPLTGAETLALRTAVAAVIDRNGPFEIKKRAVLITARRPA